MENKKGCVKKPDIPLMRFVTVPVEEETTVETYTDHLMRVMEVFGITPGRKGIFSFRNALSLTVDV
jgi:hypothetical protein